MPKTPEQKEKERKEEEKREKEREEWRVDFEARRKLLPEEDGVAKGSAKRAPTSPSVSAGTAPKDTGAHIESADHIIPRHVPRVGLTLNDGSVAALMTTEAIDKAVKDRATGKGVLKAAKDANITDYSLCVCPEHCPPPPK